MKNLPLLIAILLPATALFSQKSSDHQFILTGKVIGQDTGYVHIGYFGDKEKYIDDSCYMQNGTFHFSGYINGATRISFYGKTKSRSIDDPNWTEMFIEPGSMQATAKVNEFKKAKVDGSQSQQEFTVYNNRMDNLRNQWKDVLDGLDVAIRNNDTMREDKLRSEQLPLYRAAGSRLRLNFIRDFPNSAVSAYLLFNEVNLSLDSLKFYYALLTPAVKASAYGNRIKQSISKEESLQIGKLAPDFIQTDLNGAQISLKKFRGKYILLDFWASWCAPCREEHPYLKKAYEQFHDKGFEIIGFSMDGPDDKNAWKDAIKKDDLPWIQLCDFKVWNSELLGEYNYLGGRGIPANFLINPEGQIVAKDLRGDDVEKKLSELMK